LIIRADMKIYSIIKKCIYILLTITILIYIISGFGITEYKIISSFTFNILTKPVSHQIHNNLVIPFIILFILHILLSMKYVKKFFHKIDSNEK